MTTTEARPQGRHNIEAEESLLGAMLLSREAAAFAVSACSPADFYKPSNGFVFDAIRVVMEEGRAVDAVTVVDQMTLTGTISSIPDASYLISLQSHTPSFAHARHYADIVRRESAARTVQGAIAEARRALDDFEDPTEVADALSIRVRDLDRMGQMPERYWRSADDYLAQDHSDIGVPLVPGVVNHHTRLVIIATEKLGKSFWLRQFAFCAAAGIHPFTFEPINPVRVLILDAENDDDELVPTMQQIRELVSRRAGENAPRPALLSAPYGMDLRKRRDRSELEEVLEDSRPELIVGGPIYKLLTQDDRTSDPRHAERLQQIFDEIRKRWGCALMIEHHAPSGKSGEQRELRSIGGQRWAAWPEVTIALHAKTAPNGTESAEVRFPHPPRGHYRWPKRFDRATQSGQWPWTPVLRASDVQAMREPEPTFDDQPF